MGSKNRRKNKEKNEDRDFERAMTELELLNYQLIAALIMLYSDTILYRAIYELNTEDIRQSTRSRIEAQAYGLISRIIFFMVDVTRYNNLYERYINGEIEYSLQPNIDINIGDIFGILSFQYALSGDWGIYANDIQYDSEVIQLIRDRVHSIRIHFYAGLFLLLSTIQSINLIRNKYLHEDVAISNPDTSAIIFAVLNEIARILFVKAEFKIYDSIYKKHINGQFPYTLIPNLELVYASIFALIQSYYILIAGLGVCERHTVQPVFAI